MSVDMNTKVNETDTVPASSFETKIVAEGYHAINNYFPTLKAPAIVARTMAGFGEKFRIKTGGANGCGILGGWYCPDNPQFVKQDVSGAGTIRHPKNICEVIASRLMRLDEANKPYIADVSFIVPENVQLPNEDGSQVYVCSKGMGGNVPQEYDIDDDFQRCYDAYQAKFNHSLPSIKEVYRKLYLSPYLDLWEDAYLAYNFAPEFETVRQTLGGPKQIPTSRPRMIETWNTHPLVDVINSNRYLGLVEQIGSRIVFKDPDQHTGNYGAMPIPGNPTKKRVAGIDFAAALEKLDGRLHFRNIFPYLPGFGPTNHAREYPEMLLINDAFAEQMKKLGNFSEQVLAAEISQLMKEINFYYGLQPILETAKHIGAKITNPNSKIDLLNDMAKHLKTCLHSRQNCARKFYFEIKASLCFSKNADGEFYYDELQENKLTDLICNNRVYFEQIIKHNKSIKFRREDQKDDLSQDRLNFLLQQKIRSVLYGEKLVTRSQSIFHRIYNMGKIERFPNDRGVSYVLKTLFGFPNKGNPYNWAEWSLLGFGIITFAKNTVKLFTEYFPAVIAKGFSSLRKKCANYAANHKNIAVNFFMGILEAVCITLEGSFKAIQLMGMRLTSPMQSFKQAYRSGAKYSKALGLILGGISLAVTAAEVMAVAFLAAPAIAALGGLVTSTVVGAKIIAGLEVLGNALLSVPAISLTIQSAAAVAASIGLTLATSLSVLAATLVSFVAFVGMPLRTMVKSGVKYVYKSFEPELEAPLVHDKTDDRFSQQRIFQALASDPVSSTHGESEEKSESNGIRPNGIHQFGMYASAPLTPPSFNKELNITQEANYFKLGS